MTETEWKERYDNIMQDIAQSDSMDERREKANYYDYELSTMRDSGLPVDNDLAYLMNGTQTETVQSNHIDADNSNSRVAQTVENNQSTDYQASGNDSGDSNVSPEVAWRARYDNIMQDIANSKSMDERREKINYYNNELFTMKESGLPVENDIAYLRNESQAMANNQSAGSPGNNSNDSNLSPEDAWRARYDNIMQDIAQSGSIDERKQKTVYYHNELSTMKESGLPVDNDLAYLKVQLDEKVCSTIVEEGKQKVDEIVKNNEVLDAVVNHPDRINKMEVLSGTLQAFGGGTEIVAGAGVIGSSGGLAAPVGGYMVVDGASNVAGGSSKILNGLKGLDSSNGGGDTANFIKNMYINNLPKDGIFNGENIYNGTQVVIAGKTIKDGIIGLPKAVGKAEELYTHGGNLAGVKVGINIPKFVEKVGEIATDIKNGLDAKSGIKIPESAFDAPGYLDKYIKISDKIEGEMGLMQINNQQGKAIAR